MRINRKKLNALGIPLSVAQVKMLRNRFSLEEIREKVAAHSITSKEYWEVINPFLEQNDLHIKQNPFGSVLPGFAFGRKEDLPIREAYEILKSRD